MNDSKIINKLDNLKKLRKDKQITQLKLSIDLGISQELISRYELGTSFPQPNMLIKIADYFNCSVDYLLNRTDVKTPIKYLNNSQNIQSAELYSKYDSLSTTNKQCFDKFLNFLLQSN